MTNEEEEQQQLCAPSTVADTVVDIYSFFHKNPILGLTISQRAPRDLDKNLFQSNSCPQKA